MQIIMKEIHRNINSNYPWFRIMNDFLCFILYISKTLPCLTFRDKKLLFYKLERLLMTTGGDMTYHCHNTFPLQEPQLIVLYVWSVICVSAFWVAEVTSPFLQTAGSLSPHRVEYKVHSVHICWTAVTMAWNGNLVYKGHNDTPARNLPLLCLPEEIQDGYLPIYWVRNIA